MAAASAASFDDRLRTSGTSASRIFSAGSDRNASKLKILIACGDDAAA
jgi:hypothetical protein